MISSSVIICSVMGSVLYCESNVLVIPSVSLIGILTYKSLISKAYIGQTSRHLTQRFREHIRYIKNNDPKSAYTQHILQNVHEYGTITETMSLLKPIRKTSLLISYEQLLIQTFHHKCNLVPEQSQGDYKPLFQLAADTALTP